VSSISRWGRRLLKQLRSQQMWLVAAESRIHHSAATSHICWDRSCFSSLRPHREMLDTAGDPVEVGIKGCHPRPHDIDPRSLGSRRALPIFSLA
jgi:hypothetical protein